MRNTVKLSLLALAFASYTSNAQIKIKVPKMGGGKDNSSNTSNNSSSNTNNTSNTSQTTYKVNDKVSIEENGKWYPGYIMEVKGDQFKIHYDGYDPKYDTYVTTASLKPLGGTNTAATTTAATPAAGTYAQGQIVEVFDGTNWSEGEVFQVGGSGRYQVLQGTLYNWYYPKDMRPTNKDNANVERDKLAAQKKKDDEAKAKQDSEDQVGVIEGDKYQQWSKDVEFANDAVGQLCYYLDKAPSSSPGFDPQALPQTMKTLEQLEKVMKEKYPNAKSAKWVNRFNTQYTQQPGLYREVYEQRVTLAKRALEYSIGRRLQDIALYPFEPEAKKLRDYAENSLYAKLMCNTYLGWAYFPKTFEKAKDVIRREFKGAYIAAGIEFKEEEVFATLNKQVAEVKKITDENIALYTLDNFKATTKFHDKEAEAEALKTLKLDYPEATPVYYGCHSDYVIAYDNNWAPPKNLGKGLGVTILAKVPGIPYLVAYSCNIDKDYKGDGTYGPAHISNNGFTFWGLVNTK